MSQENILEIKDLQIEFDTDRGKLPAVNGVGLSLVKGQTLGLVGESGSGKSITSLAVMGLLARNANVKGEIIFKGENLLNKPEKEMTKIRGKEISMIFQEPMTSLNPVFTIENQISEAIILHQKVKKREAHSIAKELLTTVGIPNPETRMKSYPHQLSGGMRQRAMIAMALACKPDILIADEPTTALDVTIQAQILHLINELQEELDTSVLIITHDLGVVAQVAHQVAVMYAGEIVEYASVGDIFKKPMHPYTRGLLKTIPDINKNQERLVEIKGMVPDLSSMPKGCRFQPRCTEHIEICKTDPPPTTKTGNRIVKCWLSKIDN